MPGDAHREAALLPNCKVPPQFPGMLAVQLRCGHATLSSNDVDCSQDASRLLDLCRQSIIFDSLAAVSDCLSEIAHDSSVRIVQVATRPVSVPLAVRCSCCCWRPHSICAAQVKNRMDPAFDSARTAGYRDVVVNLQLVSEDAQLLGVARHICELQLILAPIFERKVRGCACSCQAASGWLKQCVGSLPASGAFKGHNSVFAL